jgi:transposase
VRNVRHENARGGHLFAFCNGRANRVKLLWYHEGGMYLAAKRMDRGALQWPRTEAGAARMSTAQLLLLLKGVEFRRADAPRYRR